MPVMCCQTLLLYPPRMRAAGPLAAGLISGFVAYGSSREQGEDKTVSFTNAVMAGAFTVGSTGSLSTLLTGSSLIKTATKVEIKLGASAAIGATCDFGYNLMSAAASKAYNGSIHASKKNKVNIQACAIASVIQIAVYKAKSMNWKKKSGKKPRQQPRPHHPSKKGHRKY